MKTEIRSEAMRLVEQLPDDATWEDLQYLIYVRQTVDGSFEHSAANPRTPQTVKGDLQ
jgi:catabolite regulation protein CreA